MLRTRCILTAFLLVALALPAAAQNSKKDYGRIVGSLIDSETGEFLIGVSVYLEGTKQGAISDLDGNYEIRDVVPGKYSLRAQLVGYETIRIDSVEVTAGDQTRADFQMSVQLTELEEIKVVAKRQTNTDAALIQLRQSAGSVQDAVSAETISKSGSSDAGINGLA